ncbi:ATP-dependent DNA helicase RecG [Actinomyces viscosus]|uniref:Probable DNA 3'-5' helicase RecG n=1 Tax=Actinomyces viscosus TaxID=1656 RepID=A0A448PHX4_ACTVI|nr:ATP-dependent DNA helicase RecG [Actinomyces viscosus]TFH53554.1 ATP-dependent DNA helicase RecG [Actinomyces viscosus]VEI14537.1 ATP-dependent DNA helicase recG [Actinomyces viscosus]
MTRLVGKRTAAQLAKQGVETGADLLRLLPRRYDTWGDLTDMRTLVTGEQATIQAQIVRASSRRTRSGRAPALMEATVTDGVSTMDVVQFGAAGQMRARATQLAPGTTVLMSGKVGLHRGRKQLSNPRLYVLDELDEAEREALLARPMPIYPGTEALPSWSVAKAVRTVLDQVGPDDVPDPLPDELRRSAGLVDAYTAYRWVHLPDDAHQWKAARSRLRHEEALILQVALAQRRAHHEATRTAVAWPEPEAAGSLRADLDAALPYELTAGQVRVGREIAADLARTVPMQRLLQGDVGSGKTLVALRAMLQVVDGGGQAALLAPTEVLAAQHHSSLEAVLGPLAGLGMLGGAERATRVHLLTGSTPAAQRRRILADLAAGEPAIVVGTHALLSDTVQIPFLGLVVVDEQHRFGVAQRDALRERGGVTDPATGRRHTPHLLVMTATPIPRTIAMTVFGDLATSVLDELPAGRSPVPTHLVPWSRASWVEGIWRRAAKEVAAGGRVYVVCPRIEVGDDETRQAEAVSASDVDADRPSGLLEPEGGIPRPDRPLAAVEEWRQRLGAEPALEGIGVGVLTGRMSSEDKAAAMADFASGATPVLVATTVIEVGVDVPEASMMVILDADRFGLSQLHQLRGRVGRGSRESVCVAVTGVEVGSTAFHRLKAFASTTDGFALAEADLDLRSEGDVLGASQSGRASGLDLLRVTRDARLIATARHQAEQIVAADPDLREHRALAAAIVERLDEESQAFLERA